MSIQNRVGKLEAKACKSQDKNVAVILLSFTTPDGSPKPRKAIVASGPMAGTEILPEDSETKEEFSVRVDEILGQQKSA